MSPKRFRPVFVGGVALALALSGAAGARVEPSGVPLYRPDLPGTRTLTVHGAVAGYAFRGERLRVLVEVEGCAAVLSWHPATAAKQRLVRSSDGLRCVSDARRLGDAVRVPEITPQVVTASDRNRTAVVSPGQIRIFRGGALETALPRGSAPAQKAVLRGSALVVLARGDVERPDRVAIFDTRVGRLVGAWPLPERASTLDYAGGVVLFSTLNHHGVYALNAADGRAAMISPNQPGDTPQIEPVGVVYANDTLDRDRRAGNVPLKFVPMRGIRLALSRTHRGLTTPGPTTDVHIDGAYITLAYRATAGCDQVVIWHVFWRDKARPTDDPGPSCPAGSGRAQINTVAAGGMRAWWLSKTEDATRLVSATSKNCSQRLIALAYAHSADKLGPMAAERNLFAFVAVHNGDATLHLLDTNHLSTRVRVPLAYVPRALVVGNGHVALADPAGGIDVVSADGSATTQLPAIHAVAIALRGATLAALTETQLDVYDLATGARTRHWPLPAKASPRVELRYGVAVFAAGRAVYGLSIDTGRRAVLARVPGPAVADVDSAGVAYASTGGTRGRVGFMSFTEVFRALDGQ